MRVEPALAGVVVLLVAGGIVHHMGGGISLSAYAEGGGAATVHIQGIAGMEVALDEAGELTGGHTLADAGLAAIHRYHQEVPVRRKRDGCTGMAHSLVTGRSFVVVLCKLGGREGAVHEESTHRFEVVDEHRSAGEYVVPARVRVELPLLFDAFALAVEGDADVVSVVIDVHGPFALPVGNGLLHHLVVGHLRIELPSDAYDYGFGFIGRIEGSDRIVLTEKI